MQSIARKRKTLSKAKVAIEEFAQKSIPRYDSRRIAITCGEAATSGLRYLSSQSYRVTSGGKKKYFLRFIHYSSKLSEGICGWYPRRNSSSIFLSFHGKLLSEPIVLVTAVQLSESNYEVLGGFMIGNVHHCLSSN